MVPRQHRDAEAILSRLKREGINNLYHFTSVENLPGICEAQALCSKKTLESERRGLPPVTGGNPLSHTLDRNRGNWDKVSLNLTSHTPMVYYRKREQHLCFLVISLEVAAWSGVVFTDTNATSNDHRRNDGLAGLDLIEFEIIRSKAHPDKQAWKRHVQAEVLVPDRIPLEYISRIAFVSRASMVYAERLCGSQQHPPFTVDRQLFADFSIFSSKWTVDYPHVVELILTDAKIDENVVHLSHVHKNMYSRSDSSRVTLLASVRAVTGTKAKAVWLPVNEIARTEFETSDQYDHWPHIPMDKLPDGVCSVEYYLNEVRWASIDFEVLK